MTMLNRAVPPIAARAPEFGFWVTAGAVLFDVGEAVGITATVVEAGTTASEVVVFAASTALEVVEENVDEWVLEFEEVIVIVLIWLTCLVIVEVVTDDVCVAVIEPFADAVEEVVAEPVVPESPEILNG